MKVKNLQYRIPVEIDGILVKTSTRAKRISMSFDVRVNDIILTKPKRASVKAIEEFINSHREWIDNVRKSHKVDNKFIEGGVINIYGQDYEIVRVDGRGTSRIEENKIIVHCKEESLPRKLKDFLKKYAEEKIAHHLEEKIDKIRWYKTPSFRVADPKTRWGSCTNDGRLMFSWRLIFAPVAVLDYIVAHEVSHLKHMDHSSRFWELCYSITEDALFSKMWIKKYGTEIMGYR